MRFFYHGANPIVKRQKAQRTRINRREGQEETGGMPRKKKNCPHSPGRPSRIFLYDFPGLPPPDFLGGGKKKGGEVSLLGFAVLENGGIWGSGFRATKGKKREKEREIADEFC